MATEVKVGAKNDTFALKEARKHNGNNMTGAEKALAEIRHMQTQVGRPDYSRILPILSEISLSSAKTNKFLEEMYVIRNQAGVWEDNEELEERVMQLEGRLANIYEQLANLGVKLQ